MIMRFLKKFTGLFIVFCMLNITGTGVFADDQSIHQTNLNLVERVTKLEEGLKAIVTEMRTRFEMMEKNFDKRFESIDKRFELMETNFNNRFESLTREMNQHFESIDKRFDLLTDQNNKRFDLLTDQNNKRFDALTDQNNKRFVLLTDQNNKRFDALENQYNYHGNINLAMFSAIIALIAYVIWDRRTSFDKAYSQLSQKIEQLIQSHMEKLYTPKPVVNNDKERSIDVDLHKTESPEQHRTENLTLPINMQEKFRDLVNFMNQFPEMRPVLHAA